MRLESPTEPPTLSRKREREKRQPSGSLSNEYAGEATGMLPLPPAGEGWGRSRAFEPHAASLRSGSGLQARTRTASEGNARRLAEHGGQIS